MRLHLQPRRTSRIEKREGDGVGGFDAPHDDAVLPAMGGTGVGEAARFFVGAGAVGGCEGGGDGDGAADAGAGDEADDGVVAGGVGGGEVWSFEAEGDVCSGEGVEGGRS